MGVIRPERMEIACVRPGLWRAEGYEIERIRKDGKVWWLVFERHAEQPEVFHGKRRALTEAFDLVDDILAKR